MALTSCGLPDEFKSTMSICRGFLPLGFLPWLAFGPGCRASPTRFPIHHECFTRLHLHHNARPLRSKKGKMRPARPSWPGGLPETDLAPRPKILKHKEASGTKKTTLRFGEILGSSCGLGLPPMMPPSILSFLTSHHCPTCETMKTFNMWWPDQGRLMVQTLACNKTNTGTVPEQRLRIP